jgi:Fe2+ or Zn2+ uptake regulation protein
MHAKQEIIEKLRNKGVKVTPQRIAIIDYLQKNKIHPSADEIYSALMPEYPTLSLATIYNTLDMLADLDELVKLQIAGDRVNFDYDTVPHQHFYCRECKKIYDIFEDIKNAKKIQGNLIEEVHTFYKGVCKSCSEK